MKITDVKVTVFEHEVAKIVYSEHIKPVFDTKMEVMVVRVLTDEGIEGNATGVGYMGGKVRGHADLIIDLFKPIVLNEDPLDREKIWQKIWTMDRLAFMPQYAQGAIDVALWDIAGKAANLPISKLIGGFRDKIRAYASSMTMDTVEEYVEEVLKYKEQGYTAYKLHPFGDPVRDIAACEAVREAVGDMDLMIDAVAGYDHRQALMVGRELERLNFYWYEEPLRDYDIHGYVELSRALDIPIIGVEVVPGSLYSAPEYIVRQAVDGVRTDVALKGGISPVIKTAHLAEAFGMKCEIHTTGMPMMDAANLHVTGAIKNCDFFEVLVPKNVFEYGMIENIKIENGYAIVPTKPGLGLEVDWAYIEKHKIYEL